VSSTVTSEIKKIGGAPKPRRSIELQGYVKLQNPQEKWSFKEIWSWSKRDGWHMV